MGFRISLTDYQYNSLGDGDLRPILETKTLDNCKDGLDHKVSLNLLYDSVLRITSHKWDQDGSTTVGFEYQYDLAGNLTRADHKHQPDGTHDEAFLYVTGRNLVELIPKLFIQRFG